MVFRPLASSSAGCCYILADDSQRPILIDAGIRFEEIQRAMNFNTSTLAGVLVSHSHGDHCKAVPKLVDRGIECYAHEATWRNMGIKHHNCKSLVPMLKQQVGTFTVLPFLAQHDCEGTLGFVISNRINERLLYLTDTAFTEWTFPGLTHVAIECNFSEEKLRGNTITGNVNKARHSRVYSTHMSLERLLELLKANDLSTVQEIHLLHLSAENSNAEEMKLEVQKATGIPVFVAEEWAI